MKAKRRSHSSDDLVRTFAAIGAGALVLGGSRVLLNLFGPQPEYAMSHRLGAALDSEEFIQFLSLVTDGTRRRSRLRRLKNGTEFYPEELRAIRGAQHAINLEFYEFIPGKVSGDLLQVLAERARAGVEVRLIVDAVGSIGTSDRCFDELRAAGGQMRWYHPLRWDTWQKINQRTHRKLIVIDGQIGFLGGADIADHWLESTAKQPAWRDTVFCVEGEGVAGLISTFSEN
jgi:cardiolipin synthase